MTKNSNQSEIKKKIFNSIRLSAKKKKELFLDEHKETIVDAYNSGARIVEMAKVLNAVSMDIKIDRNDLSYFLEYSCGILTPTKKSKRKGRKTSPTPPKKPVQKATEVRKIKRQSEAAKPKPTQRNSGKSSPKFRVTSDEDL